MTLYRILLLLTFLFLVSCRVQKNVSKDSKSYESIDTSDTLIQKYERINADWFRINESILRRDGLVKISFDSLTSVLVMPDQTIQAIGYNPVIESTQSSQANLNVKDSLSIHSSESLQAAGSKKKEESGSEESLNREVDKKPSLTPWIGAGLAIAIVVLAVLWYLFKGR